MKPSKQRWEDLDKLIVVAGHAVYVGQAQRAAANDNSWVLQDFQNGEPPCYIEHIRFGVELAASQPNSLLVFSGGQTRREAGPKSEAKSYWLQRVLPEFQRSFGESLPSFTKSAVCWQFCWQLQLGSSQLVDAQASKLEARVGIEPRHFTVPSPTHSVSRHTIP
jgi:hypothetical protein